MAKVIDAVQPGDDVAIIQHRTWGPNEITKQQVERVTKTQIVVGLWRFRKSDGREVGGSRFGGKWAESYDPEKHDRMFAALEEERERNRAIAQLGAACFRSLSTDKLRRLIAILDEDSE